MRTKIIVLVIVLSFILTSIGCTSAQPFTEYDKDGNPYTVYRQVDDPQATYFAVLLIIILACACAASGDNDDDDDYSGY